MTKRTQSTRRAFLAGAAAIAPLPALAVLPATSPGDDLDRRIDQLWHARREAWIRCEEAMAANPSDDVLNTMNGAINDINDEIMNLPTSGGTPTLAAAHLILALYTMVSVPAWSEENGVAGILAALAVLAPLASGLVGRHAAFIVANPDLDLQQEIYAVEVRA